jgi:hypothetical protein
VTFGFQIFDTSGSLLWDSTTAMGGVAADYQQYSAGFSGTTLSYPQWAGFSAFILDAGGNGYGQSLTSLSTSSGYPVVTVSSGAPAAFSFILVVY